eukprot:331392-Rhodomonas_salina.1
MSSFFSPQVAPLFEKSQARKREAATASASPGQSDSETVTILHNDEAGAAADNDVGQDTADDDATELESDGGKGEQPEQSSMTEKVTSLSETDAGTSNPVSETVVKELTEYVSRETQAGKKTLHVWSDLEKRMVLQLYHYRKDSVSGTSDNHVFEVCWHNRICTDIVRGSRQEIFEKEWA